MPSLKVKPGWNIPLNAVLITFVITALLSLINIGSTVAFNAIGSLAVSALLGTYIISFTCLILRRMRSEPLPPRRWTLGRFGIFVNIGAVMFLLVVWIFVFFPIATPVIPSTMNWNAVMFGGTMLFAVFYYLVVGRLTYTAPVGFVKRSL
jgi:choline transport protein